MDREKKEQEPVIYIYFGYLYIVDFGHTTDSG